MTPTMGGVVYLLRSGKKENCLKQKIQMGWNVLLNWLTSRDMMQLFSLLNHSWQTGIGY